MKRTLTLIFCLVPFMCNGQDVKSFSRGKDKVDIVTAEGLMSIIPMTDNTMRIRFSKEEGIILPELVFISDHPVPEFRVSDSPSAIEVKGKKISVRMDKKTGALSFADSKGNILLREKEGSRKMVKGSVSGEVCYMTEQKYISPADEYIFGLGQFQDGHFNIREVTRRLTQVNSQIAIPFIYSVKGYGLLWHQYGLTDFNPADNYVTLEKMDQPAVTSQAADVTTSAGTQRRAQTQSFYTGKFNVPQKGRYSIFLDLGDMGNRHYVEIDGNACIDQSNMWLPPTAGAVIELGAGEHQVRVVCKSDNNPKISWKLVDNSTTFRSPNAKILDYVVFAGSADEVIDSYRNLSGNVPMFPLWAYGFWQCRERYTSGTNLVETVREFRERKIPMDVIVQDWQYWGNSGWGVPVFDKTNYPNPKVFIKEIHDLNAHFNISIWSNPDKNSELGKEYVSKKRFIGESKWLDYFNPETRKDYWNTLKTNMFDNGVDSWWMDAVEPENDALRGEMTTMGPGDFYRLTYPLMVSQAVYEGQRQASSDKRVCILTRSAFPGQQRYGIINWSGDIGGNWDTYRRQIVAGLNFSITGLPYWTTDIGGFFRSGKSQYSDTKYHELLLRWYQWGVFNPIFRMHAYQTETEPWKFGEDVENNMRKMLDLRYRLIPYIYSEAYQVTFKNSTMMRPLIMDFINDPSAVNQPFQYMFGKSLLVAPVTEPGVKDWKVYLPLGTLWYDFWTGKSYKGGQETSTDAPLDRIPLFVKAGSIIPLGKFMQYTGQSPQDTLEIRLYKGADGTFELYEDENDNYNYEKGAYSTIKFTWDDSKKTLYIADRNGAFPGMIMERRFNIVVVSENAGAGCSMPEEIDKVINYKGKRTAIKL
ncbi:MAG TPA: TIM-barrel domain-containing protein [Bacteroidales bacterium]|nr:TIM-barrel domain-containing protein [Bacteroidales bacterium]